MMQFTDDDLLAYLDEELSVSLSANVEDALRQSAELSSRVAELVRQRDQGMHSVGEIWRRLRLSCPSRTELGRYAVGAMSPDLFEYIRFHLEVVGCRACQANLEDLKSSLKESANQPETQSRRQRFFESSAGFLRDKP